MNITVVGLGLIGGSLALDLRAKGFAKHVVGVDASELHTQQAKNRGLVDEIKPLEAALTNTDVVILAVPVDAILRLLPKVLDLIGGQTTVTDMGSTKAAICEAVSRHPKRAQYVSAHPMAGTEHSGPTAAHRGLFTGRTAVICEASRSDAVHLRRIDEMFELLQMRLVHMSPQDHDLHAAYVSHLSHISSFVLANAVLDKEKDVGAIFDLAGGGFESTVRLAKSSPDMWLPIFEQNQAHITEALASYITHLQKFQASLLEKRFSDTKAQMKNANLIKPILQSIHRPLGDKK